jgi:4-diphosphocytidyl-2-C-methyl-D-erythritol kinase
MLTERHSDAVAAWAPAKVNLYLEVLARRPDGYHEINTLMVAVSLFDTLEFRDDPTGNISLACDHPILGVGPDNLVLRGARLLKQRLGSNRGARIKLAKRIPLGGGLAGGSSDAAATLEGLNDLWQTGLSKQELAGLSAELGSDVAFFFETPAAWCTGRGERVANVELKRVLWFVLACPPFGVSTAEAYKRVQIPAKSSSGAEILEALRSDVTEDIGAAMHNRLQPTVLAMYPELAALSKRVQELKPAGHLLSGSGSTWFALCRDYCEACTIAHRLSTPEERRSLRVFIVRSCL